jgi:magnesium transporter
MSLQAILDNECVQRHPHAAARMVESLPTAEQPVELASLEPAALVKLLGYLSPGHAAEIFSSLDEERQHGVLELAPLRLSAGLLARLEPEGRERLLTAISPVLASDLRRQLSFPEDSAGRLMDAVFVDCRVSMNVDAALQSVRASRVERARSLFAVDENNRLSGRVDMQELALAEHDVPLRRLLQPAEAVLDPLAPRKQIVELLDRYRLDSLPVVDADGRLMGIVRYGSLFQAIEEVAITGLQKMVGNADEQALSTVGFSVRKRLPWLHINLLTAFLAAAVVGLFEGTIARFTALAILLPVVAGQSGNAGAQALAVTMRGLALREIGLRDWRKMLNKELLVGLVDGLALAVTCGAGVYLWSGSTGLTLVIAVAMLLSMLAAGLAGAVVPIVLIRMGQDPATASSIILTTVTDIAGFLSFLGTATMLSFLL